MNKIMVAYSKSKKLDRDYTLSGDYEEDIKLLYESLVKELIDKHKKIEVVSKEVKIYRQVEQFEQTMFVEVKFKVIP